MLRIRLSRVGKKSQPNYRITIAENARDTHGKALEILGSYNPRSKELNINAEQVKYWLGKGAQMSPTVNNLLIEKSIIEGKKVAASKSRTKKAKKS